MKKILLSAILGLGLFLVYGENISADSFQETSNTPNLLETIQNEDEDKIDTVSNESLIWDVTNDRSLFVGDDQAFLRGYSRINRTKGYFEISEPYQFDKGWTFKNVTFQGKSYKPGDRIYDEKFKTVDMYNTGVHYNYEASEDFYVSVSYSGVPSELVTQLELPKKLGPFSGQITMKVEAPEKVIPGYEVSYAIVYMSPFNSPINLGTEYTFTNGTFRNFIDYQYKKVDSKPIVVHYTDLEGRTLIEDVLLTGEFNESYKTESKDIEGYHLKEIIGNPSGIFDSEEKEVTYRYEKDITELPYLDYKENTIISITNFEMCLEIIKDYNVSIINLEKDDSVYVKAGTTGSLNILNKQVTISKKIETKNGNIYYTFVEGNKEYVILSQAFKASNLSPNNISTLEDLHLYSSVSLDYLGNYLADYTDISANVRLVKNYNIYDLFNTGGNADINANSGTVLSLNLMDMAFQISREYISSGGGRYYNIIINEQNYFINKLAFDIF